MATKGRGGRRRSRVIDVGQYTITAVGNSKGVFCFKKMDKYSFPSKAGESIDVFYREEGPDGDEEIVLKPATDGN